MDLLTDLEIGEAEIIFGERRQVLMVAMPEEERIRRLSLSLFHDMIFHSNFWLAKVEHLKECVDYAPFFMCLLDMS